MMSTRSTDDLARNGGLHAGAPLPRSPTDTGLTADMDSFVGRSSLLREALNKVANSRLLTLIGPGGVGKTRLVQRIAQEISTLDDCDCAIVPLVDLRTADERLDSMIARALGLMDSSSTPALDRVIAHLRDKPTVLVLDNCEHLIGETPGTGALPRLVQTLIAAAPRVHIVATSLVRLNVDGEHTMAVPPLCTGGKHCTCEPGQDRLHAAARLFIDRAVARGVQISAQRDHGLVNRLCRQLDGIPLALELAAIQLDTLTLREIVDQHDPLRLLVDGDSAVRHHRTMRATLDRSFHLLLPTEQRMWGLLSVFEGGFDLEAAEAVCAELGVDSGDVLHLLARLVRKSLLLTSTRAGRTRYRMLSVIRQYGRELVEADGSMAKLLRAHARYFADLTDRAAKSWFGPDDPGEIEWLRRMTVDVPNLRAAQEHLLSVPETALRGLELPSNATRTRAFYLCGELNESQRLLDRAINAQPPGVITPQLVGALAQACWIAQTKGEKERADQLLDQAETLAREIGLADDFGPLLYARGTRLWVFEPDPAVAVGAVDLLLDAAAALKAQFGAGDAHMAELFAGIAAAFLSDRDTAVEISTRTLDDARAAQAPMCISWALWTSALVHLQHLANPRQALALAHEALDIQVDVDDAWGWAWSVWLIAVIAGRLGKHELCGQMFGATQRALQHAEASEIGLLPFKRLQEQVLVECRRELGEDGLAAAIAVGEAYTLAEGLDLARQLLPNPTAAASLPCGLSEREFEVAALIAKALTNKEIAAHLGISPRTVEVHVARINTKLSTRSRLEIAAWHHGLSM